MKLRYTRRHNKKRAKTRFREYIKRLEKTFHIIKSTTRYSIDDYDKHEFQTSVISFKIKELPEWLFAIWNGGYVTGTYFIGDIETCIDKFKPLATSVSVNNIDEFIGILRGIITNNGYLNDEQKGTYLTLKQRQIDIDIENLRRYNYVKSYCFLFNEVHGNICKIYIKMDKYGEPKYHEVFIEEYSDIPETTLEALRILQTEFKKWDIDGGNFGTDKYSLNYDLYNC